MTWPARRSTRWGSRPRPARSATARCSWFRSKRSSASAPTSAASPRSEPSAAGALGRLLSRERPRADLVLDFREEPLERLRPLVAPRAAAHAGCPGLGFLCAQDQRVGHLFHLGPADLGAQLVVVLVERGPDAPGPEPVEESAAVVERLLADGDEAHLLGREPDGEVAAEVLDQHPAEPLHRAEGRSVDHDRPVRLVVRAAVRQVEPDGEIVVHLDRTELPFAPDHVLDDEVDLWAVERGLPGLLGERNPEGLRSLPARVLRLVPVLLLADVFARIGIPEPDAHPVVAHPEGREDDLHKREASENLLGDLLLGAEEVGVI